MAAAEPSSPQPDPSAGPLPAKADRSGDGDGDGEDVSIVLHVPGEEFEDRPPHPVRRLLAFASQRERVLLAIASVFALIGGGAWPLWSLFFGQALGLFDPDEDDLRDEMDRLAIIFVVVGAVVGITRVIHAWLFRDFGARVIARIRFQYVRAIVRQEMGWHDVNKASALEVRLTNVLPKLQAAISHTLEDFWLRVAETLWGLGIGFYASWKLTLVFIAFSPLLVLSFTTFLVMIVGFEDKVAKFYETSGVVAHETLALIKTVMAFGTYDREKQRYSKGIEQAKDCGVRSGRVLGVAYGLPDFAMFSQYALAFWYGGTLVRSGEINGEDIMICIFGVLIGMVGFGQAINQGRTLYSAFKAATDIFSIIDRVPKIDTLSDSGKTVTSLKGNLDFEGVDFAYPAKPDATVLDDFNLSVPAGQSVALCGSSGSGKSTIISLLERFYDATKGTVRIDGVPITEYNTTDLRRHIGLVTQTPVLFPGTIFDNIAIGKEGATRQEVEAAAQSSNAHDFITSFPEGYDTAVGDLGSQLSGGQRQRIAIARVLISNPSVLLLDEATSALDNTSESIVQNAIDTASQGRTVVTVAHRLSTIRNADVIVVLEGGRIAEKGSHEELVERKAVYWNLLQQQQSSQDEVADVAASGQEAEASAEGTITDVSEAAPGTKADLAEGEQKEEEAADPRAARWAWAQSKPEAGNIALSILGAFLAGLNWPACSVILAESLNAVLFDEGADAVRNWAIAFIALGIYNLLTHFMRVNFAFVAGEKLTFRLRQQLYNDVLHQEIAWFDQHPRDVTLRVLSTDVGKVRMMVADFWSMAVLVATTLIGGVIVGLIFCWKITLVLVAVLPVTVAGTALEGALMTASDKKGAEDFAASERIASFLMTNTRLLASLAQCRPQLAIYQGQLERPVTIKKRAARKVGLAWGLSELLKFSVFGLAFWYGGVIVDDGECSFNDMIKALLGVLFCGLLGGIYGSQLPDYGSAKTATTHVLNLYRSFHYRDSSLPEVSLAHGGVEFKNVTFSYPTRPGVKVLDNFSLKVSEGETVALVGESGSGKSTILSMTQGLYLPSSGQVLVGGSDTSAVSIDSLRTGIALVDQEPKLFDTSIRNNVAYSSATPELVQDADIVAACDAANATDFINEMPDKFETEVGLMGDRLSGGQRQRVSIARALLRGSQIRILLLDEATSALDTVNERKVQEAIERARAGRTSLVVAHRLSTIQNADRIVVMDQGRVAEIGTHDELLRKQGVYAGLYAHQVQE